MKNKSTIFLSLILLSTLALESCISPSISNSSNSNNSDSLTSETSVGSDSTAGETSESTSVEPDPIILKNELFLYLGTSQEIFNLGDYVSIENSDESIVKFESDVLKPLKIGAATIRIEYTDYTQIYDVYVLDATFTSDSFTLLNGHESYLIGERIILNFTLPTEYNFLLGAFKFEILSGFDIVKVDENDVFASNVGQSSIQAYLTSELISNSVNFQIINGDRYDTLTEEEFYADYYLATSNEDAKLRSEHFLMSGDISEQDQEPTVESNRPTSDGKFIRNTSDLFSDDKNTYYVLDKNGQIAKEIYKDGAYVTVDDVAAYVYAYGYVPANYTEERRGNPSSSGWGKYLRCNYNFFSGSTEDYPYEPVLPDIYGCGGNLMYYEIDIGTTGTDCDPNYTPAIYNDGNRITRGAARMVFSVSYDDSGLQITDLNDRYVFYTYNHYNDFQEYLNYENGWGEMFGNITGGGEISSYSNYNPTDYVEVVRQNLYND